MLEENHWTRDYGPGDIQVTVKEVLGSTLRSLRDKAGM